ncbi:MAG: hypothetical protein V7647_3432 [Acidobacteriota bacterium]|jgi:uncharacterized protein
MLLDLNKLHGARDHVERTFQPADFEPQDIDYRVVQPVHLSLDLEQKGGTTYRVAGRVKTILQLECGRCLEDFPLAVDAPFDLRYVPQAEDAAAEAEREITEDDLTTAFYTDGMLDLIDLMREQFQLALPMKPLCAQSCRGLCSVCGANLNRTECDCKPVWEDPRLAPLKGLLNREKES